MMNTAGLMSRVGLSKFYVPFNLNRALIAPMSNFRPFGPGTPSPMAVPALKDTFEYLGGQTSKKPKKSLSHLPQRMAVPKHKTVMDPSMHQYKAPWLKAPVQSSLISELNSHPDMPFSKVSERVPSHPPSSRIRHFVQERLAMGHLKSLSSKVRLHRPFSQNLKAHTPSPLMHELKPERL